MIDGLDIGALWPSPLGSREQAAFRRELSDRLADRFAVAKADQPAMTALKQRFTRSWRTNQTEVFIGAALALKRINGLKPAQHARVARALLTQDRFAEAFEVTLRAADDTHLLWFDRARALAGFGRLAKARLAAETALERLRSDGPGVPVEAVMSPLKHRLSVLDRACQWRETRDAIALARTDRAVDPEALVRDFLERRTLLLIEAIDAAFETAPPADWTQAARRAAACLLLGLERQAFKTMHALAKAGVAPDPGIRPGPLLRAVSACAPAEVQPTLLRLYANLSAKPSVRAYVAQGLAVISGETPWPVLAAASPPSGEVARMVATALAGAGRREPAISLLAAMTRGKRRQDQKCDLATCINRQTIEETGFSASVRSGPRRVFDLFPYNGEIELLKIKLGEMAAWVDRFVIVESAMTFTGQPKPLAFPSQRAELGPYLDKIVYLPLETFPTHVSAPWAREFYQRDQTLKALCGLASPDDIVLLTDVDEVVAERALDRFDGEMAILATLTCRFFLNHAAADLRPTSSIWRAAYLERWGPSFARHMLASLSWTSRISDSGWHFTSIGDAQAIARKLASYSHEEHNRPDAEAAYAAMLDKIRAGELDPGWRRAALEELPAYVGENLQALAHLMF